MLESSIEPSFGTCITRVRKESENLLDQNDIKVAGYFLIACFQGNFSNVSDSLHHILEKKGSNEVA
jgi:hypothetical protein